MNKSLSALLKEQWTHLDRCSGHLFERNPEGKIKACCALGGLILALDIDPAWANATNHWADITDEIDRRFGCKVFVNHDPQGLIEINDAVTLEHDSLEFSPSHDNDTVYALLDQWEAEACHE